MKSDRAATYQVCPNETRAVVVALWHFLDTATSCLDSNLILLETSNASVGIVLVEIFMGIVHSVLRMFHMLVTMFFRHVGVSGGVFRDEKDLDVPASR